SIRIVFDSDLNRTTHNMVPYYTMASQDFAVPPQIVKAFAIEVWDEGESGSGAESGAWRKIAYVADNHQRLVRLSLPPGLRATRLRFTARETWGSPAVRVFAIDLY
ncbi:MAG: hypothetical protein Q8O19_02825, partial [Rectinemataceae bacterium]|nr:hypothetical protein [Rectinemataceae bacterium]